MKLYLTLPAGFAIFASSAVALITTDPIAVDTGIEVDNNDPDAIERSFDLVAAELSAAGRQDLLPALTHQFDREDEDGEMETVRVVYTPIGQRVEQSIEDYEAGQQCVVDEQARLEAEKEKLANEPTSFLANATVPGIRNTPFGKPLGEASLTPSAPVADPNAGDLAIGGLVRYDTGQTGGLGRVIAVEAVGKGDGSEVLVQPVAFPDPDTEEQLGEAIVVPRDSVTKVDGDETED